MSEEFKYVPYNPKDGNLMELIQKGNVYNLRNGLFLPENDMESDELFRDVEYMKDMYPAEMKRISEAVSEECDKLEYEGSPMLVEYPDREELRRVARTVYDVLIADGYMSGGGDGLGCEQENDHCNIYERKDGCTLGVIRHIIEMLICNEFCVRRDRHRRRRRRFYL